MVRPWMLFADYAVTPDEVDTAVTAIRVASAWSAGSIYKVMQDCRMSESAVLTTMLKSGTYCY
jgi:hypothetical protein